MLIDLKTQMISYSLFGLAAVFAGYRAWRIYKKSKAGTNKSMQYDENMTAPFRSAEEYHNATTRNQEFSPVNRMAPKAKQTIISSYAGSAQYTWDGTYLDTYAGGRIASFDGQLLHIHGHGPKYKWTNSVLSEYGGRPLFSVSGNLISQYAGGGAYTFSDSMLSKYAGGPLYSIQGDMTIPIPVLIYIAEN
ncbi:MAG: hypothetical protein N4A71_16170 [Carboxylicivirga sp.]|jgi:hypothetical protein|nr:hypothetical protein [Carboxylicivirga sp.]